MAVFVSFCSFLRAPLRRLFSVWVRKQLFSQFIVDFPDHSDAQPTCISLHVPNRQSWFLEVNTLKPPDMGCFSAVFKSCGPTSRQRRPVRLWSSNETFSFYGFPLTINWGFGYVEEMNRHRPITAQSGSCSFLSNLSCPELCQIIQFHEPGHYTNSCWWIYGMYESLSIYASTCTSRR